MIQMGSRTWGAKTWFAVTAVALGAIFVSAMACTPQPPQAPSSVTIINNNTNTNGGSGGSSPAPGSGSASGVDSVTVNGFGQGNLCPAGVAGATGQREVKVGCRQAVTCNPRDVNGKVIFDLAVTGATPSDFSVTAGDPSEFAIDDVNGFNGEIHGKAAGTVRLACTVKGKVGVADFSVVP